MPRYKLTIEYDGGPFVGWQRQANGRAVQQAIEEALCRLTQETPTLRLTGGTHAVACHLDVLPGALPAPVLWPSPRTLSKQLS